MDAHVNHDLPRMFRSAVLALLWAIYESAVYQAASCLKEKDHHGLSIKDIKGKNDLDSWRKYFEHVLKFPLFNTEAERSRAEMLRALRKAILHANGRIDEAFMKRPEWKLIEGYEKARIGISFDYSYLEFTAGFIEEMLSSVSSSMNDLLDRVGKACSVVRTG